jgi:hypothetical protein
VKTVFSNQQCAHVWAQQTQPHGHSGSMEFEGKRIYSYRTVIACFHESAGNAQPLVLINSNKYSVTTSGKHMPCVRDALRGLNLPTYTVPECSYPFGPLQDFHHIANCNHLEENYREWIARLKRMRDEPSEWYYQRITDYANAWRGYCGAFALTAPTVDSIADADAVRKFRAERAVRLANDPNRAKKAAQRVAAKERAEERKRLARAEASRIALLEAAERLALWQSGAIATLRYGDTLGKFALLRLLGDRVQTSRGAEISVREARAIIPVIRTCIARSEGCNYEQRGDAPMVGSFTVRQIHRNGDVVIGCHEIQWCEIERIAAQLGV